MGLRVMESYDLAIFVHAGILISAPKFPLVRKPETIRITIISQS